MVRAHIRRKVSHLKFRINAELTRWLAVKAPNRNVYKFKRSHVFPFSLNFKGQAAVRGRVSSAKRWTIVGCAGLPNSRSIYLLKFKFFKAMLISHRNLKRTAHFKFSGSAMLNRKPFRSLVTKRRTRKTAFRFCTTRQTVHYWPVSGHRRITSFFFMKNPTTTKTTFLCKSNG